MGTCLNWKDTVSVLLCAVKYACNPVKFTDLEMRMA